MFTDQVQKAATSFIMPVCSHVTAAPLGQFSRFLLKSGNILILVEVRQK